MELLTVKNLITYWTLFGNSELPKAEEGLIRDTIQSLKDYKEVLEKTVKGEQ